MFLFLLAKKLNIEKHLYLIDEIQQSKTLLKGLTSIADDNAIPLNVNVIPPKKALVVTEDGYVRRLAHGASEVIKEIKRRTRILFVCNL